MLIHRMNASFGKIRDGILHLHAGLNVLQVPDQDEPSDWFNFFCAICYGFSIENAADFPISGTPTHAPVSGTSENLSVSSRTPANPPVSGISGTSANPPPSGTSENPPPSGTSANPPFIPHGQIVCQAVERELTLSRSAPDSDDLSGEFHIAADGTVPAELTARNCGEFLLGLPRTSFERAALISPSDFPAGQSPCIPAHIVPEEKKNLESQLSGTEKRLHTLLEREKALEQEKELCERREAQKNSLAGARKAFASMEEYAAALRKELDERHVPELDVIGRLRVAIVNLRSARKLVERAEDEQKDAEWILQAAEESASRTIFGGKSPEEAAQMPISLPPEPVVPLWLEVAQIVCAIALVPLFILCPTPLVPVLDFIFVLFAFVTVWVIRQRKNSWDALKVRREKRRKADLERYFQLYHDMEEARAEALIRASATESLRNTLESNENGILREVRRFAPGVTNLAGADEQLRDAARRRKELSAIESGRYRETDESADQRSKDSIRHDLTLVREESAAVYAAQSRLTERLNAIQTAPLFVCCALEQLDDEQCTGILDELRTLAEQRQILLFTTQTREADYFSKDSSVHVQRTDNPPEKQDGAGKKISAKDKKNT